MNVTVNGQVRDVPAGATIRDLLDRMGLPEDGIAVAIDRAVVPRSEHRSRALTEGQSVEVIRAVGGG